VPVRQVDSVFFVRLLERAQGEPFRAIAGRVAEIARGVRQLKPASSLVVVVDQSGLGLPVIELVREELHLARVRVPVTGALFVHGERLRGRLGDPELSIGKERLVSGLTALMENDRLRLPAHHPLAGVLEQELKDYQIRVRASDGNAQVGAFGASQHDDLVTSLTLATLAVYKPPLVVKGYGDLFAPGREDDATSWR
jgi:hypothetical protein